MLVTDLGTMEYRACWELQHRVFEARRRELLPDCLLLVEHPPVLTLGKRGGTENILLPEHFLHQRGISCVPVERGGDVTYHGPGQLVGYPIVALRSAGLGVTDLVNLLEEVMIRVLADFSISGRRDERNRGVWVGEAKIGFVGIAVRRGISFHGLALNVHPDLGCFDFINPCGLKGIKAVSMRSVLGREVSFEQVKASLRDHFARLFPRPLEDVESASFLDGLSRLPLPEIEPGADSR